MAWFLLTWNPDVWAGITDDDWDAFVDGADNGLAEGPWGTGARRSGIRPGDGILFLRQGRERGLLGTGEAISEVFEGQHFDDPTRVAHYVEFTFTEVRRIRDRIPTETLLESVPEVAWNALMGSGVRVPAAAIDRILQLWQGEPGVVRRA